MITIIMLMKIVTKKSQSESITSIEQNYHHLLKCQFKGRPITRRIDDNHLIKIQLYI